MERKIAMAKRTTLRRTIEVKGKGLHGGRESAITLVPSYRESGIMICASREKNPYPIGDCELFSPGRSTCLVLPDGEIIYTVEHLLASLYGMGVDDAVVVVEGGEVPIFDGSALPWAERIKDAGLAEKDDGEERPLNLSSPLLVEDDEAGAWVACFPSDVLKLSYIISFDNDFIGTQVFSSVVTEETFLKDFAPARTFVRLEDVDELKKQGLALGGSLDNALVFDDKGLVNDTSLRFENECVRHKAMDLLGDLSLVGKFLCAHVVGFKAGHRLHLRMVERLKRLCRGDMS